MKLFLVRHGESEGNVDKSKYFEKLDCDIELTNTGRLQAESSAIRIHEILRNFRNNERPEFYTEGEWLNSNFVISPFDIYCSTYTRAIQTRNIILEKFKKMKINYLKNEELPLIREREWGGLRDIVTRGMKTEGHFNFYYRPTNGESFADAQQRVIIFHQHLMNSRDNSGNILVVAHGELIKLYVMYLLKWSIDDFNKYKSVKNGEVLLIEDGMLSSMTPLTLK